MRSIREVSEELGIHSDDLLPYGHVIGKVSLAALGRPARGAGRIILVSAVTPTPAGEGKTTVSVGLAMGLRALGRRAVAALREPSLGPVFGLKGGATGGGKAQLVPGDKINLHFTGDLHAITSAHNLLAALVDNQLHFGSAHGLDARRTTWGRAVDMNDRALRKIVVGLGGEGVPRETRFDITAASEVMAVLCLATSREDLTARLARIVVGRTKDDKLVTAGDIGAAPAMTALLLDALSPNLVQTAEGGPAFVHGGPFANIAHGCSSILGTRLAAHLADEVVTEAGFAFDLGAVKFLDIKCRAAGIWPRLAVIVCTLRALRMHGGVATAEAGKPNAAAVEKGLENLDKHVETARAFGVEPVVAINVFADDPDPELKLVEAHAQALGTAAARCTAFAHGGEGAIDLARLVLSKLDGAAATGPRFLYPLEAPYEEKLRTIARTAFGADDVNITSSAHKDLDKIAKTHPHLPVCVAKTHLSLSDDPKRHGRPRGFTVTVREARLLAGAGFVTALTGEILTMPGLPKEPAANRVRIDESGKVHGLMQND